MPVKVWLVALEDQLIVSQSNTLGAENTGMTKESSRKTIVNTPVIAKRRLG
jgi:hypothetical protein